MSPNQGPENQWFCFGTIQYITCQSGSYLAPLSDYSKQGPTVTLAYPVVVNDVTGNDTHEVSMSLVSAVEKVKYH